MELTVDDDPYLGQLKQLQISNGETEPRLCKPAAWIQQLNSNNQAR
jgi:hypothetical protein